jgi:hypothetical protein
MILKLKKDRAEAYGMDKNTLVTVKELRNRPGYAVGYVVAINGDIFQPRDFKAFHSWSE